MSGSRRKLSRREFLIALGLAGGGLAVGVNLGIPKLRLAISNQLDNFGGIPESFEALPQAWFEFSTDNTVRLGVPKIEMGQGIHTAFAQLAAEELDIPWESIRVYHLATHLTAEGQQGSGITGSSTSVSAMFIPLREAAATMRQMIRMEAAKQWGISISDISAENGVVFVAGSPEQSMTYGEIVSSTTDWEIPEEAPALKTRQDFKYIGKPQPRLDLVDKITGKTSYGYDARLPGMLFGAAVHPPVFGAEMQSASNGSAEDVPGVVTAVIRDDFAGVVAESRVDAQNALKSLNIRWSRPKAWNQDDLEALIRVGYGESTLIQDEGEINQNLETGETTLQAEYRTPFAAHAHLEPQAALANVTESNAEIWTSTQAPWSVQRDVAEALGFDPVDVHVYPTYPGGAFGRRIGTEVSVEAAVLSQAVQRPVHVGWDRADEFQNGFLRPATHSRLQAKLTPAGNIKDWAHQFSSGDVSFPSLPGVAKVVLGADFGATRGAKSFYGIPNRQTIAWRTDLPIPTGWWRGLGLLANTFAMESFMDELAFAAGFDPITFRLRHLPEGIRGNRYQQILEKLAEKSNWGSTLPAGRAQGVALCDDGGTIVGQVSEVSIEAGQIRVHRAISVMDCGLVVNPDGARAQVEGCIMMGLSSTLKEQIRIEDGRVNAVNFDRYPLISMRDTPDIEVELIHSENDPSGVGEPPIGPVAASVANAVFALTGERIRSLPLKIA